MGTQTGLSLFENLTEKRFSCIWDEKKCNKIFKKDRPKIQYESFFDAKINDDATIGLAIAARLLRNSIVQKKKFGNVFRQLKILVYHK